MRRALLTIAAVVALATPAHASVKTPAASNERRPASAPLIPLAALAAAAAATVRACPSAKKS